MKLTIARSIASVAVDMIATKVNNSDAAPHRLAAEYIRDSSKNGTVACAAVLAVMGALFDRKPNMIDSEDDRTIFATQIFNLLFENGGTHNRRHKEWIKTFYWLRDGGDSSIDDIEYYAAITLQGCKTDPINGMAAAWQLCTALRGAELRWAGEYYADGKQPDAGFKAVFDRLAMLVRAMVGPAIKESPKPFTVFVMDQITNGYSETPFIAHVDAISAADIEEKALISYRAAHGLPVEGWREFSNENGAYPFLVIPGHIDFSNIVWNADGLSGDDCAHVWSES